MQNITSKIVETRNLKAYIGTEDNPIEVDVETLDMTFRELFALSDIEITEGTDVVFTVNGHIPADLDDSLEESYFEDGVMAATLGTKPQGA